MSRIFRFTLLSILVLFTFACGLISNPLNQAKGLASTAEAIATAHPVSVSTHRGTAIFHAAIHAGGAALLDAGGRSIS